MGTSKASPRATCCLVPEARAEGCLHLVAGLSFEFRDELLDGRTNAAWRDQGDFDALGSRTRCCSQKQSHPTEMLHNGIYFTTILTYEDVRSNVFVDGCPTSQTDRCRTRNSDRPVESWTQHSACGA